MKNHVRLGRGVACLGVIGLGALLGHLTLPGAPAESGTPPSFPPPMRALEDLPSLTAQIRVPIAPSQVDPEPLALPAAPFGEAFRDGQIITGATPHRLILFTFDDGPDPRNTPRLLDTLDELGIRAVFFMTASRIGERGRWQRRNLEIAQDVVRRGHIVANHTFDHAQLPLLDDAAVLAQVQRADDVFERVLGGRTWLVRPPGGGSSRRVDRLLAERGYTQLLWNLGTGDFQVREAEEVVRIWRRVLARRERENGDRGGIILLHDTHAWSVDAVPMIVSWVRDQNCRLLEEGEELFDIVDDPALFFAARPDGNESASLHAEPAQPGDVLAHRQAALRETTGQRCARLASR